MSRPTKSTPASPHAGEFVLKGGVLLAVFDARRPTADAELRQQAYSAFKKRLGPDADHLPDRFGDVVNAVIEFADPLADGEVRDCWDLDARKWW